MDDSMWETIGWAKMCPLLIPSRGKITFNLRDFPGVKKYFGITVVTPGEFLRAGMEG